jgi:outer membrane lipoprotein-sorting protein
MITEHTANNENTFIVAKDPKRKSQGSIKMVFSNSPVSLQGWTITNQSNQKTKIILDKLDKKTKIPLYLFNISAASKNKN